MFQVLGFIDGQILLALALVELTFKLARSTEHQNLKNPSDSLYQPLSSIYKCSHNLNYYS